MPTLDWEPAQDKGDPPEISELGLTPEQTEVVERLLSRQEGLILFSGPPGSGKSRSAYSVLAGVDRGKRSFISVEDPIEYRLADAKQQEVEPARGAPVEFLLGKAVAEEPDILFFSEIDDMLGAWTCVEYAKDGHLAVSTIPSCNATTAIFRLERLGVPRDQIGEAIVGVVGQRLLHRLCSDCRDVRPLNEEEAEMLAPFTSSPPEEVADAVGCQTCGGSGFHGKRPLFEVIEIDPDTADLIGDGLAIADVRQWARENGTGLLTDAGLDGIRDLDFPVDAVYEDLLLEDLDRMMAARVGWGTAKGGPAAGGPDRTEESGEEEPGRETITDAAPGVSVLVVEDDLDTRVLVERLLSGAGYSVSTAEDGAVALVKLATEQPDLILSDIHMPNLDGMKLLELVHQHGIKSPVVLLTAEESEEVERRSYELGAKDYLRKPVDKTILLESLGRVLASE